MHIIPGSAAIAHDSFGPCAVGIGIFDGVHLGHQALLRKVTELAHADGIESVAFTFNPHPARVLNPELAPRLIEPVKRRLENIAAVGISTAVVEPFDKAFAARSPEAFVRDTLVGLLSVRHVVVGAGFTFGARQRGNVALLQEMGEQAGFEVHPVEHVRVDGIVVSSTKIREFTRNGKVRGAIMLLGRPFQITGVTVRGAERGSRIGFGTANVETHNELIPAPGVYGAVARGRFGIYDAVVNVGFNPTFGEATEIKIEAHFLDYAGGPLYGSVVCLEFLFRLRDERRFESVDALRVQIQRDIDETRRRLNEDCNR